MKNCPYSSSVHQQGGSIFVLLELCTILDASIHVAPAVVAGNIFIRKAM